MRLRIPGYDTGGDRMSRIDIKGAREHNLTGVDLSLPREALIVFTGVSGSGKSSLAFDTLHAEGQRRYLEALSIHARGFSRGLSRPAVDAIDGLPPTVALDQRYRAPSRRMTVGTFTDVHAVLAVLYSRAGVQHCPICDREIRPQTHDEIVNELMGLEAGTRLTIESPVKGSEGVIEEIQRAGFSRVRAGGEIIRIEELNPRKIPEEIRIVVDRIRVEPDRRGRVHDAVRLAGRAGRGVIVATVGDGELIFTDRPYCLVDDRLLPVLEPRLLSFDSKAGQCGRCGGAGVVDGKTCSECGGTRLSAPARAVRWRGMTLPELLQLSISDLAEMLSSTEADEVSAVALADLSRRLRHLTSVGLGALSLHRSAVALSRGEFQRLRLGRQVASKLSGILYVLDEPTAGLHADEVPAIIALLKGLVTQGNTVVVVEHQPDVVRAADFVVDFGPGPGRKGGRIVYEGGVEGLLETDSPTGQWLSGRRTLPQGEAMSGAGSATLRGLSFRNLSGRDVSLPIGALGAITGRSGSGKTSVLEAFRRYLAQRLKLKAGPPPPVTGSEGLEAFGRMVVVDRSPARSPRSNPATYSGMWETVRDLFASTREAQIRGLPARFFSLNVKGGRCEACHGTGQQRVDLDLLPDVYLTCPICDGRRFNADVLEVTWKGHSADQILALSVDEAHALLAGHPKLENALRALRDVGLGYVGLGQPAHTLSGGEAHRMRLARELARAARGGIADTVYLIDDPTSGLHPADVAALLVLLRKLVADGGTVWMATHHDGLARGADFVVEL